MKNFNIKIDNDKLKQMQGIAFSDADNWLYYVQGLLYTLNTHNKNYTKEQIRLIDTLKDIFDCVEVQ